MLKERDEALCALDGSRPPSYFFSSFFVEQLMIIDKGYRYKNVEKWSKKIDAFKMRMVWNYIFDIV